VSTKRTQNGNKNRKHLEAEAEEVRAQLLDRVSQLDERRDRIVKVVKVASKPPLSVALAVAAGAVVVAAVAYRIHSRRKRSLERLVTAWLTPPYVPEPDGMLTRTLKNAFLSVVSKSFQELGRRGVDRLIAATPGDVDRQTASA
jgi:hypothetical protein